MQHKSSTNKYRTCWRLFLQVETGCKSFCVAGVTGILGTTWKRDLPREISFPRCSTYTGNLGKLLLICNTNRRPTSTVLVGDIFCKLKPGVKFFCVAEVTGILGTTWNEVPRGTTHILKKKFKGLVVDVVSRHHQRSRDLREIAISFPVGTNPLDSAPISFPVGTLVHVGQGSIVPTGSVCEMRPKGGCNV